MKKIFFLLNRLKEFNFGPFLEKHITNCSVTIGDEFPHNPEGYTLIILWNYRKKIVKLPATRNVILFHCSDLPEGRGWAPIYNSIANDSEFFVISGIFAAPEIDTGDIIVKARFRIRPEYDASSIRQFDSEISIMMTAEILRKFDGRPITGVPQSGAASFNQRRRQQDNRLDVTTPLEQLIPVIRACESDHPAFFFHKDCRFIIEIRSEREISFPEDLEILFPMN